MKCIAHTSLPTFASVRLKRQKVILPPGGIEKRHLKEPGEALKRTRLFSLKRGRQEHKCLCLCESWAFFWCKIWQTMLQWILSLYMSLYICVFWPYVCVYVSVYMFVCFCIFIYVLSMNMCVLYMCIVSVFMCMSLYMSVCSLWLMFFLLSWFLYWASSGVHAFPSYSFHLDGRPFVPQWSYTSVPLTELLYLTELTFCKIINKACMLS